MAEQDASWTGTWVAEKIRGHENVATAKAVSSTHVQIDRLEYGPVLVGTTAAKRLDAREVRLLLDRDPNVDFIVNVPAESYVTGEALSLAEQHSVPVGGVGDLMRALVLPRVRQYVNKEVEYIHRGLRQHTRITKYRRLADRLYRISRRGFADITVVFLYAYELTADHLRVARDRYGSFDLVVNTNPYGKATSTALAVRQDMELDILNWRDFLSQLHQK